jgi:hypothetical protein
MNPGNYFVSIDLLHILVLVGLAFLAGVGMRTVARALRGRGESQ